MFVYWSSLFWAHHNSFSLLKYDSRESKYRQTKSSRRKWKMRKRVAQWEKLKLESEANRPRYCLNKIPLQCFLLGKWYILFQYCFVWGIYLPVSVCALPFCISFTVFVKHIFPSFYLVQSACNISATQNIPPNIWIYSCCLGFCISFWFYFGCTTFSE